MKNLKGNLSIGRPIQGDNQWAEIRLEDEQSLAHVILIRMPLESFAKALLGQGYVECEFDFNDTGIIGMKRENKTELVPVSWELHYTEIKERTNELLAPFEIDGWVGRRDDLVNHHCHVVKGNKTYQRVVFVRHVKDQEGEKDAGKKTQP